MTKSTLMSRLDGVFVPMFTPFHADGASVNEEQLRDSTRRLIDAGVPMLNPAGTTGEFWTLTPEEHRLVIASVLQEARRANPATLVIPGTSAQNLAGAVEMTRYARENGATMVQVAPPYYLPMSDNDLVAYYKALCEEVDVAVMVYEIPIATGVYFKADLLERLCDECPNVIALKTASPAYSPRDFERIVHRFGKRLRIFSATGAYYSTFTYMTGVAGITDTIANIAPLFGLELHRLARAQAWQEMSELYRKAFDVLEIELLYGRAGLKYIAEACGQSPGPTRFPMTSPLTDETRQDIRRRLAGWSFTRDMLSDADATVPLVPVRG